MLDPRLSAIIQRIEARSIISHNAWKAQMKLQEQQGKGRRKASCGNLAHAIAACSSQDKARLIDMTTANLAIISGYNDLLSAHQPYEYYPRLIKTALAEHGHTAQVAGSTPAMCDGVTQGQSGMEMSLFSRDLIAQATALSLSHNMFDATLLMSVCDKVAPGQLMGALSYGHLPTLFIPTGPMATGVSNEHKTTVRRQYAEGQASTADLLQMECSSYHSAGTCTFYGTANTNQLVFEAMGLMLPGAAFVPPTSPLRDALTKHAALMLASHTHGSSQFRPLYEVFSVKSLLNGVVALLASGGSTNHTLHMVAIARCAGIQLTWQDIHELSDIVPLLVKMYPNGSEDINAFQAAGGMAVLMQRLAQRQLLSLDAVPAIGRLEDYFLAPQLDPQVENDALVWRAIDDTLNPEVIAPRNQPFSENGGLRIVRGNIGTGVVKISAIAEEHRTLTAPAKVFTHQDDVEKAFHRDELNQDVVVVVKNNGPAANGMPELHKLMPLLAALQKRGHSVALLTDGRLSGASGKVPSIIHVSPEACRGGAIDQIHDGDIIEIDLEQNHFVCHAELAIRATLNTDKAGSSRANNYHGWGRELFATMRSQVSSADMGATIFNFY
uniref:phosphogluconate dehydratase n=1 Tax=Thaumasiovibrio occultus TaxID=1891184 RepID=UPI000B35DA04|nr:phosphogluconate dehydratase [Thaumasiovibrio occultus]